ncbi:Putative metal chaperone [Methylophaga frappieri]|uniref:Putative metal chaperone n=1 Tax=Methylophaga frappieri (strain ATCC BAA-2434 / DSM 25690 / JAM7) TaxID=754477 RepID=I1YG86_METFJ|nr:GTP-binding protein [Methylophaga frappieri]AFJ01929.1 Putative metal chaperone [Methylophaga frappieri]
MTKLTLGRIQRGVATNVITGFLGVGKTSAIQQLLKQKPDNEHWAILINEFGKVGIDRQLLTSQANQKSQIEIREVVGGCMCCTAVLPMQVALNQLLRIRKWDRLIIEPSGLGHPKEVIATLRGPDYQGLLDIRATITLVDARHFRDTRYIEHAVFQQQLRIADALVVNKTDLSDAADFFQMHKTLKAMNLQDFPIYDCEQGEIKLAWLSPIAKSRQTKWTHSALITPFELNETPISEKGWLAETQELDGWFSFGWRFADDWYFDSLALMKWCHITKPDRCKAVMKTRDGTMMINAVGNQLTHAFSETRVTESRLEMLFQKKPDDNNFQPSLFHVETCWDRLIDELGGLGCRISHHLIAWSGLPRLLPIITSRRYPRLP